MEMPFIDILCKYNVRFVLIGGQAMRFHGMPRFTMDWDICIPYKDVANFERLNQAVLNFSDFVQETIMLRSRISCLGLI